MKVIFNMIRNKGKDYLSGEAFAHTKEALRMISDMAMVNVFGVMGLFMKDYGITGNL